MKEIHLSARVWIDSRAWLSAGSKQGFDIWYGKRRLCSLLVECKSIQLHLQAVSDSLSERAVGNIVVDLPLLVSELGSKHHLVIVW